MLDSNRSDHVRPGLEQGVHVRTAIFEDPIKIMSLVSGPAGGALIFFCVLSATHNSGWLPRLDAPASGGFDLSRFICSPLAPSGSFASLQATWLQQFAMWTAMFAAMMFPGLSPCGDVTTICRWHTGPVLLRAGYALPGLACSAICSFVQAAVLELGPRGASGVWTFAGLVIAAGLYQWTPWKRGALDHLCELQCTPAPPSVILSLRTGLSMGRACLVSNIGLMIAMADSDMTPSIVIACFAAIIVERRSARHWGSSPLGIMLIAAGVLVAAAHTGNPVIR